MKTIIFKQAIYSVFAISVFFNESFALFKTNANINFNAVLTPESPIPNDAVLVRLADRFKYTEGPCIRKDGSIVFSDMQGNAIYRWTEQEGAQVLATPTGTSNGLAEDLDGNLIIAQFGAHQIGRLESDGTITTLIAQFQGKQLNSPNDIVIKSDGSIYFTDPGGGGNSALGFSGVYRFDPENSTLVLLTDSLERPNGIIFSPDESVLYVADTNARRVLFYDVLQDGSVANGSVFTPTLGQPDGLAIDKDGNLFVAAKAGGIEVYSSDGILLDHIDIPESVQNLTLDWNAEFCLYITAGSSLYRLSTVETGVNTIESGQREARFELKQNYPNPFNPETVISYQLFENCEVSLAIFNTAGQEVGRLVDEMQVAGRHTVAWDARNMSSGFYIYKLRAGSFSEMKRMVLVK